MTDRGITSQANLETLENQLAGEIDALLSRRLGGYAEREAELETLLTTGAVAALEADIAARCPDIERFRLSFHTMEYPDFSLYRASRQLYEDFLVHQRQILTAPLSERAGRHVETQLRMEELSRYGELLTKYPVLLQYLSIERGGGGE
jgi:hypothetical protein